MKPTFYLREYIVPRWGALRLNEIQPQAVEDWLHTLFAAWWTRHGVRAIMNRIFNHAERHGLWEQGKRRPSSGAKLGKKRPKRERRIPSFEEAARVLARLEEPNRLIIETCIATGARISEVLGLTWGYVNLNTGTIKIEQHVRHQEVGHPKSEGSKRVLGIGDLVRRYAEKATEDAAAPDSFVFQQKRAPGSRCGTRVFAMLSTRQRKRKGAISQDLVRTPFGGPTLPGVNRSAEAQLRHQRSPATAIWR
jgi:integrase